MMWVASKSTMVLSNVPGPKRSLVFDKAEAVGFGALIPGLGDLAIGISAMSMADRLYMAIQSDTSYIKTQMSLKRI